VQAHQIRRIALDSETVALLRAHKEWTRQELAKVGVDLSKDMYAFMNDRYYDTATRKYVKTKDATEP
jgi:integrase